MGFFEKIFGKTKLYKQLVSFKELGGFMATFRPFGKHIYASDLVRSCIRPLAEHTSKANVKSSDKRIERLLNYKPNPFMNGKDFLAKCRNILEVKNTLFIFLSRDDRGRVTGFYPVPYEEFETLEYNGRLFVKFKFMNPDADDLIAPWEDLAVARKDYIFSDIAGEDNGAILATLDLISTTNQGLANAIKSTASLRGILKFTKAMFDEEDIKESKDRFVKDYMGISNSGGIAALDPTQEFIPVRMEPAITSDQQMKVFREDLFRYFGVNDDILMSKADESVLESFYTSRIEPFLVALSLELTSKCFTDRELGFDAYIHFESSKLLYASLGKKIQLFREVVLYGGMTVNEWRRIMNYADIEGGDDLIRRLDTAPVNATQEDVEDKEE